jgi:hypothetical protein
MIGVMTAANTTTATESVTPEEAQRAAARAAAAALAARQVRLAAGRWLTVEQIPVLGAAMVSSIHRYEDAHRRPPTWAEAVAGVDPVLLAPIQDIPDGWPLQPGLWRRELRQQLMGELRRTGWVSYSRSPRSLRPGGQGRGLPRTHGRPATAGQPPRSTPPA